MKLENGKSYLNEPLFVENCSVMETKTGKSYLNMTVRTKGKESINGKIWDYKPEHFGFVKAGVVLDCNFAVTTYNNQLQITISGASTSSVSLSEFQKTTQFDVSEMWDDIIDIIEDIKEPLTKRVAQQILTKTLWVMDGIKIAPAAKGMHNAWIGGLLEHIHTLCNLASPVVDYYKSRYGMPISKDKVMFGLILHDLGKIMEYKYDTPAFDMTGVGLLTNHLVIGPAMVYEECNKNQENLTQDSVLFATKEEFVLERSLLMHVVAAHHGTLEWGSPVTPCTLEAVIVHHFDNLDAQVMHAYDFVTGEMGPIPGFSKKSWMGRYYYQPEKEVAL